MKVWAGCYNDADRNENPPTIHLCGTEKELVDALLDDIGSDMEGISCNTLEEVSEQMDEYCENPYSSISWTEKDL